jgi:ribosomal protein S18 acetylase RimI-like enzyme
MKPILYFLRSSEQKILTDMLHYALRLDETGKKVEDIPQLCIYEKHYGYSNKDIGLYALTGQKITGAAWIRLLKQSDAPSAYIDDATPVLIIGVKSEFRGQGIGSAMLEQLLLEIAVHYEQISVSVLLGSPAIAFYERFGFVRVESSENKSPVDGSDLIIMTKKLHKQDVKRPSDGYDPRRWMD